MKLAEKNGTDTTLRFLHLEDDTQDAGLIAACLDNAELACEITQVETRSDFIARMESEKYDLVLADIQLPDFDGQTALALVRERWPEIPVIILSGTVGEEQAIEFMKNGATDYVLKERLARLVPAVRRALQEVEARVESRIMEAQFVEAQKMEVVGHLASGVAHDFNNILSVILGYGNLMMAELEPESFPFKCAEEIQHAAERAVGLTRQLLVFSRKETITPVVLDLNEVIADMEKMLRRLVNETIEMIVHLAAKLGHVFADSGHLGQVLMNLAVNARDAMPGGGTLTITTANVVVDEAKVPDGVSPGNFVLASVADTGTGMTDEVKSRLFEAFFTTKPAGQGTGLGLATCQSIVRRCGGFILVESELNRGTVFQIYFPSVDLPLAVPAGKQAKGPLSRGTETLLMVEDEPSIRHLTSILLETQGYTVLQAKNGQEGLNMARDYKGGPISLVITDVIMPQMGGKVMAEWLQSTYPEIKILFTSGYTDDAMDTSVHFLPKPYTPTLLIQKVRQILDTSQAP